MFNSPSPAKPSEYVNAEGWWEAVDETEFFWGKSWEEISVKNFEDHDRAFTFYGDDNIPYFMGCLMWNIVKTGWDDDYFDLLKNALIEFQFDVIDPPPQPQKWVKGLRQDKLDVLIRFLEFVRSQAAEYVKLWIDQLIACLKT